MEHANHQAVAADNPSSTPQSPRAGVTSGQTHQTASADVAGGRGNAYPKSHRFDGEVVRGLGPCKKWSLWTFDEQDGDGFVTPAYFARSQERDQLLHVSRFDFEPTQERFNWLVLNGFPTDRVSEATGALCPWDNASIDAQIAAVRAAA